MGHLLSQFQRTDTVSLVIIVTPKHENRAECLLLWRCPPVPDPPEFPSLEPTQLHHRLVEERMGGYCFFHGLLMTNVILGLVHLADQHGITSLWSTIDSARAVLGIVCLGPNKFETTREPTHCVCLINVKGGGAQREPMQYVLDVGFGRRGRLYLYRYLDLPNLAPKAWK